jgi:hypothetical protein
MPDPWLNMLADVQGTTIVMIKNGDKVRYEERITTKDLLTRQLGIIADKQTDLMEKRVRTIMTKQLGWKGKNIRIDGKVTKGYCRVLEKPPFNHPFLIPVETVAEEEN